MIRRVPVTGFCLQGVVDTPCLAVVDDETPIRAGDFVIGHIRAANEVYSIVKRLETYDGKWFLWASTGVVQLAGHQFVLAHIERVVQFESLPADRVPAVDSAHAVDSLGDIELQDYFSREARMAWNRYGFPRGVEFPGLDAIYPYRGPEVKLPAGYVLHDFGEAT